MWVFGYGSLMWDGWQRDRQHRCWNNIPECTCTRRQQADLLGYRRTFNKASIVNWGSDAARAPTLNLERFESGRCGGIAFEFPDRSREDVLRYLRCREGRGFSFPEVSVSLGQDGVVDTVVPIYHGPLIIDDATLERLTSMVIAARGKSGSCIKYVRGIAQELEGLGIADSAVTDLWKNVQDRCKAKGIDPLTA